jgi:hypothetical protein
MGWAGGAIALKIPVADLCGAITISRLHTIQVGSPMQSYKQQNLMAECDVLTPNHALISAWYKAVSDAVVSVDSQLSVGGPASSDCWGNGVPGAKCYGGQLRPTIKELLEPGKLGGNWALGLVEFGAATGSRVDFASSHSYSTPCGTYSPCGIRRFNSLPVLFSTSHSIRRKREQCVAEQVTRRASSENSRRSHELSQAARAPKRPRL